MERLEYNKIYKNGEKHIEAAKALAEIEMYGFAISHLILGMEELIKYMVIMLEKVNNYDFDHEISPEKGKSIFNDHIKKHDLIEEFYQAISTEIASKNYETLQLTSNHSTINQRFNYWGLFFNLFPGDFGISIEEIPAFLKWLREANLNKNLGFYADRNVDKIETPDRFTLFDYEVAFKYVNSILKQTAFMKSTDISKEEFEQWNEKQQKQ